MPPALAPGSAALAGLTAAATVVPGALTGPVLGAWLDVVNRRRLLVVIDQLLSAVALWRFSSSPGMPPIGRCLRSPSSTA